MEAFVVNILRLTSNHQLRLEYIPVFDNRLPYIHNDYSFNPLSARENKSLCYHTSYIIVMSFKSIDSNQICDEDEEATFLTYSKETGMSQRSTRTPKTLICALLGVVVVVVAATGAFAFGARVKIEKDSNSPARLNTFLGDCGDTPTAARLRGCIFDPMSFTWDFPACYDAKLSNEFRNQYGFRHYEDWQGTVEVPYEIVALGERDLHSSWEQHLMHCLYTWKKFNYAYNRRKPIDSYIRDSNHTDHCGDMWIEQLYTPSNIATVNTINVVKYTSCFTSA